MNAETPRKTPTNPDLSTSPTLAPGALSLLATARLTLAIAAHRSARTAKRIGVRS
jgi:hypothetical protein